MAEDTQRTRKRERAGPWSRDVSIQDRNEFDYVIGRLQNITGAAEGPNLPPIVRSGERVISPSNFTVVAQSTLENAEVFTLSWNTPPQIQQYNPTFRVHVEAPLGNQYVTVTSPPATITVPAQGLATANVKFMLETRLANGMVSLADRWPVTMATMTPIENYQRSITASYSADPSNRFIHMDTTAGPITLTLPDVTTLPGGYMLFLNMTIGGGYPVSIAGYTSTQTVDGSASISITTTSQKWLICTGSVWLSFVPS